MFFFYLENKCSLCVLVNTREAKKGNKKQKCSFFTQLCFCLFFSLVKTLSAVLMEFFNKTRKSDALNLSNAQRCTKPLKLTLFLLTFTLGWLQERSVIRPGGTV